MNSSSTIWLSWHNGTRSRNIARLLSIPFLVYSSRPKGFLRHVIGSFWTISQLIRYRPAIIFLQNSFMLLLIAAAYKRLVEYHVILIADCHNKSLKRRLQGPLSSLFWALKKWSFQQVDSVIVSNSEMLKHAHELSNDVLILRDPLPADMIIDTGNPSQIEEIQHRSEHLPASNYVLIPCSFESDEPINVICEAALLLAEDNIASVITGNASKVNLPKSVFQHPMIHFPGYVSNLAYCDLLSNASAVIALTEDQDCLMCAAYEAVAANRLLVVSDTSVLRSCFGNYAVYTNNDSNSVVEGVHRALSYNNISREEERLRFLKSFQNEFNQLLIKISEMQL